MPGTSKGNFKRKAKRKGGEMKPVCGEGEKRLGNNINTWPGNQLWEITQPQSAGPRGFRRNSTQPSNCLKQQLSLKTTAPGAKDSEFYMGRPQCQVGRRPWSLWRSHRIGGWDMKQ